MKFSLQKKYNFRLSCIMQCRKRYFSSVCCIKTSLRYIVKHLRRLFRSCKVKAPNNMQWFLCFTKKVILVNTFWLWCRILCLVFFFVCENSCRRVRTLDKLKNEFKRRKMKCSMRIFVLSDLLATNVL